MIFHFDASEHRYTDAAGAELPSVTTLCELADWTDSEAPWMTTEHRRRGRLVHEISARYDLGAPIGSLVDSPVRGYVLAYLAALAVLGPSWEEIEVPYAHPSERWCGTIDRFGRVYRKVALGDLKSGCKRKSDAIKLALYARLVGAAKKIPPAGIGRYLFYLSANGRFEVREAHELGISDRAADDEAARIVRKFC